jgi:hypothetical protein
LDLPPDHVQGRKAAAGGFVEDDAEPVSDGSELFPDLGFREAIDLEAH